MNKPFLRCPCCDERLQLPANIAFLATEWTGYTVLICDPCHTESKQFAQEAQHWLCQTAFARLVKDSSRYGTMPIPNPATADMETILKHVSCVLLQLRLAGVMKL